MNIIRIENKSYISLDEIYELIDQTIIDNQDNLQLKPLRRSDRVRVLSSLRQQITESSITQHVISDTT